MSIRTRLDHLEKAVGRGDEPCPGGITLILGYCPAYGEPQPEVPPDAPRCDRCGKPHVLVIEEVIVEPQKETAMRDPNKEQAYREEAARLALIPPEDQQAVVAMYRQLADNPLATKACRRPPGASAGDCNRKLGIGS
jgi:hypothetical protein